MYESTKMCWTTYVIDEPPQNMAELEKYKYEQKLELELEEQTNKEIK